MMPCCLLIVLLERYFLKIKVGTAPFGITLDKDKQRLYAVNVQSEDVSVIDIKDKKVIHTFPVDTFPYIVAIDGARNQLFVTNKRDSSVSVC